MAATIKQLEIKLFEQKDGNKFSRLKDQLIKKFGDNDRKAVLDIFMRYVETGQLVHWRNFLLTDIIRLLHEGEAEYSEFWERCITKPDLAYWSVDGLLKTKGKEAYSILIGLLGKDYREEVKNKAVKSLAIHSKQPFDRGLPSDPAYWKPESRRISEIDDWQNKGYPVGEGYTPPKRHVSLDNPQDSFEKLMVRLDKKLALLRSKQHHPDLANPQYYLTIAEKKDINAIIKKWNLPDTYLKFLKYYSPLHVTMKGISLYGADVLIRNQAGYSYHGNTKELIADWPENYIVIADKHADPYCIDISNTENGDAKIYESMHGMGKWEFNECAPSFSEFIKMLCK